MSDENPQTLLVCTVGGSAAPVVASILHWRPAKMVFVPSLRTRAKIDAEILPPARAAGATPGAAAIDVICVNDEQSLNACLADLRRVWPRIVDWVLESPDRRLVVDFTGGTKAMSAALALVAQSGECVFSYVGGGDRTREGVGIVVDGREQVVQVANPTQTLGIRALDRAIELFDAGSFDGAITICAASAKVVLDPRARGELSTLRMLAEAYRAWDAFRHGEARSKLSSARERENDFASICAPRTACDRLARTAAEHEKRLTEIGAGGLDRATILDLVANARRRSQRGHHDDGVARLYRATEAILQLALKGRHLLDECDRLTRERMQPHSSIIEGLALRADSDGVFRIGLRTTYDLLRELNDDAARRYEKAGFGHARRNPLSSRNMSILAHGFKTLGRNDFDHFFRCTLDLLGASESDLVEFPRLRSASPP